MITVCVANRTTGWLHTCFQILQSRSSVS